MSIDLKKSHNPHTIMDKLALWTVKSLRVPTDIFFKKRYGCRAVMLEIVAAVLGMVGGMLRHLRLLRRFEHRDGQGGASCLYMDGGLALIVTVLPKCADVMHLMHVWLQFKLAYVSRESLVVGCGKLIWDARLIAKHYFKSVKGFWFDIFVILLVPQVIFWLVVPKLIREEEVKVIMSILLMMFIFQFLPKVYHSICVMRRMQKVTDYIFRAIWWGFALNLIAYFIASH